MARAMMRSAWLLGPFVALLVGCGDLGLDDDKAGRPGSEGEDGGSDSVDADGGAVPPEVSEGSVFPDGDNSSGGSTCQVYDLDQNGEVSCDGDEFCAGSGACCVGSGACCEDDGEEDALSFNTCTDTLEACAPGKLTPFGDPAPSLDNAFRPGGDASFDSGAVVSATTDLTLRRLTLDVRFRDAVCPTADCLEAAGVAVTSQALDDATLVRPAVGLLWSASLGTVTLFIENNAVASWDVDVAGTTAWRLTLAPTGQVMVSSPEDDSVGYEDVYAPFEGAKLVLYGRNEAGGTSESTAGILSLSVSHAVCDVPTDWTARDGLPVVDGDGDAGFVAVRGPTVATGNGDTFAAFERDGAIYFGAGGLSEITLASRTQPAALAASGTGYMAASVADPELVWDALGDQWVLFFTATDGAGHRTIGRASMPRDGSTFTAEETPIIAVNGINVDAPSVTSTSNGTAVLVARVTDTNSTYLDAWTAGGALGTFVATVAPGLRNLTRRTASDALGAFDRDEVASPSVHVQNHAFHLYYAGRRGTRWGVGLLTSDNLVGWRVVAGGAAVLAGDGAGFDGLGVTDPDAFFDGSAVRLVYVGMDGGKRALGRASRRAPAVAYAP